MLATAYLGTQKSLATIDVIVYTDETHISVQGFIIIEVEVPADDVHYKIQNVVGPWWYEQGNTRSRNAPWQH